jgi:DNA invertase Pin-like site-specific DNA recombinase
VIDELDSMGVEFISRRENVDTSGPMGRLFVTIISAIAELDTRGGSGQKWNAKGKT